MKLKTTRKEIVEEYDHGLWAWETLDGQLLGDEEGNIMNTPGNRHDPEAVKRITDAARFWGFQEGKAVFLQGKRQISDEEFAEQKAREAMGLVADPFDLGAINDEMRAKKYNHGQR